MKHVHCLAIVLSVLVGTSASVSADLVLNSAAGGAVADADGNGSGDNVNGPTVPGLAIAGINGSSTSGPGGRGTRRLHFEWDISALTLADVGAATVTLTGMRGSIDQLDTFLFHVTADGDGLLSESDFQGSVSQFPGVVLPVSIAPAPSDIYSFTFDVTSQLRSDIAGGNSFFSVQGRVDETNPTTSNRRGLQVARFDLSTPGLLQPRLTVSAIPEPSAVAFGAIATLGGFFIRRRTA